MKKTVTTLLALRLNPFVLEGVAQMVSALVCHTKGRGFKSPLSRFCGYDLGPARARAERLTHASHLSICIFYNVFR